MSKVREIQWPRILAEATAIVVSILLAFSIQAWWDERRDRDEEIAILGDLLTELQEFNQSFENHEIYVTAIRQSAQTLLEASASPDPGLSDSDVDRLLSDINWFVDPTVLDLAALQSTISGGLAANISNDEIRRKIATWFVKLNGIRSAINYDFGFYRNHLMPFLRENVSHLQLANVRANRPGFPEITYPDLVPQNLSTISHLQLLENREFQNLLFTRIVTLTNIVEWQRSDIQTELLEILDLIEYELTEKRESLL